MPDTSKISYRPPTVAGAFYPADETELRHFVDSCLATGPGPDTTVDVRAIIVPHAGYVYSGGVAGKAYSLLKNKKYDSIVILAPSHQKSFQGASVFDGDAYVTPLGVIKVDKELSREIAGHYGSIVISRIGHGWTDKMNEHAIEVQLPFLQQVLPGIPIVPIVLGSQDTQMCDQLMQAIVKAVKKSNKKVLIVASSDLSHYHDYETARSIDLPLTKDFERSDYFKMCYELFSRKREACGAAPIITAIMAAEQLGAMKPVGLQYATSADVEYFGTNKSSVVGYFSGAIMQGGDEHTAGLPVLDEKDKQLIIETAKNTVERVVRKSKAERTLPPVHLDKDFAAFVTLTKNHDLRGCMGHTIATMPLFDEIEESAKIACTQDYRFGPVRENELKDLEYEVTVLSRMRRILNFDEIKIGEHGLYIRLGNNSGLLLPQVATNYNWDTKAFLENLSQKAGLNKDAYLNPDAEIYVFRAIVIN
jgi:AmmeMemoRadiSam system protein B/AmmeMemoRadiSam system protein A